MFSIRFHVRGCTDDVCTVYVPILSIPFSEEKEILGTVIYCWSFVCDVLGFSGTILASTWNQ